MPTTNNYHLLKDVICYFRLYCGIGLYCSERVLSKSPQRRPFNQILPKCESGSFVHTPPPEYYTEHSIGDVGEQSPSKPIEDEGVFAMEKGDGNCANIFYYRDQVLSECSSMEQRYRALGAISSTPNNQPQKGLVLQQLVEGLDELIEFPNLISDILFLVRSTSYSKFPFHEEKEGIVPCVKGIKSGLEEFQRR